MTAPVGSPANGGSRPPLKVDRSTIERYLRLMCEPGHTYEVCVSWNEKLRSEVGYFNDDDHAAKCAAVFQKSGDPAHTAFYLTVNPVKPDLLARGNNRLRRITKQQGAATADHDVARRTRLVIDIEAKRPSGISATEAEHEAALIKAQTIAAWLREHSWPEPMMVDSGNGAYLIFKIDLPNDDGARELVQACLKALAAFFDDPAQDGTPSVHVDLTMFNAARLARVAGTVNRKGDSISDRPHRLSQIVSAPPLLELVAAERLMSLAGAYREDRETGDHGQSFDLAAWLAGHAEYLPPIAKAGSWQSDGYRWVFGFCPWNRDHADTAAYVARCPSGALIAGCHHDGCSGKGWKELRKLAEVGSAEEQKHDALEVLRGLPHNPEPEVLGPAVRQFGKAVAAVALAAGETLLTEGEKILKAKGVPRAFKLLKASVKDAREEASEGVAKRPKAPGAINGLPCLDVSMADLETSLSRLTDSTSSFLATRNKNIYRQGGELVRIRRDDDRLRIEPLSVMALRGEVDRVVAFIRLDQTGLAYERVFPPDKIVENLHAAADYREFHPLHGIASTPFISPSGGTVTTVGYHPETKLYLEETLDFLPVPEQPTDEEVHAAIHGPYGLLEPFRDFPFEHQAGRPHALAMLITPVVRPLIDGATPLIAIDASTPGSGKQHLIDLVNYILIGRKHGGASMPTKEDEIRKKVLAVLRAGGAPLEIIDNVNRMVDSAALASVVTTSVWRDRVLGESKIIEVPNRVLWVLNGNNMTFSRENTRRVVWIRLVPKTPHPEQRTDFKRPEAENLRWTLEHRPELFRAILVLIQNWIAKGRPAYTGPVLGSFGSWCEVVGGILQAAGIEGFLSNRELLEREANEETDVWQLFIEEWWTKFKNIIVTTEDLLLAFEKESAALLERDSDANPVLALGHALTARRDQRWDLEDGLVVRLRRFDAKGGHRAAGVPRKGWYLTAGEDDGTDGGSGPGKSASDPESAAALRNVPPIESPSGPPLGPHDYVSPHLGQSMEPPMTRNQLYSTRDIVVEPHGAPAEGSNRGDEFRNAGEFRNAELSSEGSGQRGRPRKWESAADRQRAYRVRRAEGPTSEGEAIPLVWIVEPPPGAITNPEEIARLFSDPVDMEAVNATIRAVKIDEIQRRRKPWRP